MHRVSVPFLICVSLAALHLQARAAVSPEVEAVVNASLALGTGCGETITALTADPFNLGLEDATVAAIEAGGDSHADACAAAGVAAASTLPQAESVAEAARAASVSTTDAVDAAIQEYVRLMDQPYIHHDGVDPTGGGAYNPQGPGGGGIAGGTRPPVGGTRPPVSNSL